MPIPTVITDLSATAASNSPSGSDAPSDGDNFLRAHGAFIKQLYDGITAGAYPTLAGLADTTSDAKGDAFIGVKRTQTSATGTTQHLVNEARPIHIELDYAAPTDGSTTATAAIDSALTNGGKRFLQFGVGGYACQGLALDVSRQHFYGQGYTSDSATRAGAYLAKNANGTHATISADDVSLGMLHVDGVTASYSGDGMQVTGTRFQGYKFTISSQRGYGMRVGGASSNSNLWGMYWPISINNGGQGVYIHHTGGSVTGDYPSGIPDANAGVMIGGDIRSNGGVGVEIDNAIDNVFIGTAIQNNTGKGIVLRDDARGHAFFKPYLEGNNGGLVNPGDELDIETGAVQNIVIGNRFVGAGGASGYRDANAPGENLIVTYEDGIGHFAWWGLVGCWNPLTDTTGADARFYKGTSQANIVNHRHTLTGTSGGKWQLQTKADGGAVSDRLSVDAAGLTVLQNTTGGILIGKTAADTTTAGIQLGDSGSGNNTRINMVGSGSSSDTKLAFYNSNGSVGTITTSGTATAYNTSSDYRLKEEVTPASEQDALNAVLSWPIRSFKWKATGLPDVGVIAHELQSVKPSAVTGDKDGAEVQGVDYSKLVPELVAAVQYLAKRVAELEK
jgi:Chaperone of endosialidase